MGSFSWRVNGIPNASIGGRGIPEGVAGADPVALPDDFNDTYLQKVTKVIPVEIVGGYTLALQIAQGVPDWQKTWVLLWVFLAFLFLTLGTMMFGRGLYQPKLIAGGSKRRDRQELIQIVLAVVAFLLWAYLQGGVFASGPLREVPFFDKDFWPYSPALAALAVIIYAVVLGWFKPDPAIDPAA